MKRYSDSTFTDSRDTQQDCRERLNEIGCQEIRNSYFTHFNLIKADTNMSFVNLDRFGLITRTEHHFSKIIGRNCLDGRSTHEGFVRCRLMIWLFIFMSLRVGSIADVQGLDLNIPIRLCLERIWW